MSEFKSKNSTDPAVFFIIGVIFFAVGFYEWVFSRELNVGFFAAASALIIAGTILLCLRFFRR